MKNVSISVIMPVYNSEKYLAEAIESVLNQSYKDFEFIIIDDCSKDNSWKIIEKYSKKDKRIKAYKNVKNLGISKNRNKALTLAKGNYIAMLDSDDVAYPTRLQKQIDFLENNKDYGLVTGNIIIIDENSKETGKRIYPHTDQEIRKVLLKYNPFAQPASMFRKELIKEIGNYREDINVCEDYDFFLRIASKHKVSNLNENLIKYRISSTQSKSKYLKKTISNTLKVQKDAINKYGYKNSLSDNIYRFLMKTLLILPDSLVMYLFKKIRLGK